MYFVSLCEGASKERGEIVGSGRGRIREERRMQTECERLVSSVYRPVLLEVKEMVKVEVMFDRLLRGVGMDLDMCAGEQHMWETVAVLHSDVGAREIMMALGHMGMVYKVHDLAY